ncbi:hypothetical protein DYB26_004174 [Aphanomyces astaci]|uniref:Uncharacterized protein n=2 Tax=Aphanomyces astaci TaxID=112090 RepID=A0A3R7CB43_APHAT|nr:hypothetical protein DYB26_004174 [Aphanomyces astaci]
MAASTLGSYRSAIVFLYEKQGVTIPQAFQDELPHIMKGYSRFIAADIEEGVQTTKSKRPLTIEEMKRLTSRSVALADAGCTHAYLLLTWNLMGRSGSTASIHLNSLSWEEDCLGVQFRRLKTAQEGVGPNKPRHCFANPLKPNLCVVLALGLYLVMHPTMDPDARLFPAVNPGDNFSRSFAKLVHALVALDGVDRLPNVATHSIRKGAVTFASSGCTSGPSTGVLTTRARWSLGDVLDRYNHYAPAGDQYAGRIVSGLPESSAAFGTLPPHFGARDDPVVADAVRVVFPTLCNAACLSTVLRMCLASVVYHREWLVDTFPQHHTLFSTVLFRNKDLLHQLAPNVTINDGNIRRTGIPPHRDHRRRCTCSYISYNFTGGKDILHHSRSIRCCSGFDEHIALCKEKYK